MKIKAIVTLVSLFSIGQVFATDFSYDRKDAAQLTSVKLDPKLMSSAFRYGGGMIEVNYTKDTVKLIVYTVMNCKPHQICPKMMPAPMIVELPIVDIYRDILGATVIDAKLDKRMVDGALQMIRVTDNTTRYSQPNVKLIPTRIEYQTKLEGRGGKYKTYSTFTASPLNEVVYPLHSQE